MPDPVAAVPLARDLLALTERMRERLQEDPSGNPVLAVSLAISRRIDAGQVSAAELETLVRFLRDSAFADRAGRLAAYVGAGDAGNAAALARLAARLVRPDPADSAVPLAAFRALVERPRFAAVFTAHPTFALPQPVAHALAEAASGRPPDACFVSHRPAGITLEEEFAQAVAAMTHGRDALDRLTASLLAAARDAWPGRWTAITPRPVVLASWVGYDTDGRTDIHWWDTLRLRLRMKRLQLDRLHAQVAGVPAAARLAELVAAALAAVAAQIAACPETADPDQAVAFAHALVDWRDAAFVTPDALLPLFDDAIAMAPEAGKLDLAVARAGLLAHGMSLAHTHVRLNSAQVHNVVRQRLGLADPPEDPSRRRGLLSDINAALDAVRPVGVDFGAVLAEQASAARLMMTVAQIVKLIDGATPIRFLIAETETGYTLLAALWLARLFGVERHVEISPLFETADALEHGARVVEEALRSPHWRAYLRTTGRLAVQFGYSDSGRYVGQIAASYLIERLRLKIAEALGRHGLADVEVVLFDTHGESVGRGAHPGSLAARLDYLSPPWCRRALAAAGIAVREESAFQGGDGYLLFGTPELALATVTRIAEHAFPPDAVPAGDPIYDEADFAADFFATSRAGMQELVEAPGYAALLGAFGPALLDATGSRPAARQTDGMGGPATIRHPRELRAIPNNAILHQLGWLANTLQGLGTAAARHPETFTELREGSPRFGGALDLAAHAAAHSDVYVLRAVVATLDPGTWLDRAAHARLPGRREALVLVARGLERLDLWAPAQAMFRRIQADHVALRAAWPDVPRMATREMLLHALRLTLIHRIWLLATAIPDFSPRHGVTRAALDLRILRLDVPAALAFLAEAFPAAPDPAADRDYGEPRAPRAVEAYMREHAEIFAPMQRLFALVREIGTAVTHEVGALG
ncbi:phosphoenolpyruvate carboxylase [Rhodovastum sp. RN2-1]|uniref:Phosphoenolpyruvate carboxylase n=1 Tax=Limobrevibacterium gyesilva TaxID=2991712 RepID=A0AA41YR57_9PROT|nr:phosphoenolpyruvate carboxylase [Limobrevibacterium gyesilva]